MGAGPAWGHPGASEGLVGSGEQSQNFVGVALAELSLLLDQGLKKSTKTWRQP